MRKTHQVKIEPNAHMTRVIEDLFNYRRYCWNQALATWNDMYDESVKKQDKTLRPSNYKVRNTLVANKQDWQYNYSSRVLQIAVLDLNKAWQNFFNKNMPNHKRPRFKAKKNYQPTFTTDNARIVNGKLVLDKPKGIDKANWYSIKLREHVKFTGKLKQCTVNQKADGLYASLVFDTNVGKLLPKKSDVAGVDVNVKHFNYNDGIVNVYPEKLEHYYEQIIHYNKMLARKRLANTHNFKTKRYTKVKTKLRRAYQKVANIQMDILHKFTMGLITKYGEIHIEDLDVYHMIMSKHMGKNLQRSMFGKLNEILTYKCEWYHRKLVKVPRQYPSTQLCSNCGYRKTKDGYGGKQTLSGDSIHHNHQKYYCYNCGAILDRDENAVENIKNYVA